MTGIRVDNLPVKRNGATVFTNLYELNAYAEVHLTERCRLRGGYTAMWLVDLPVAQDQFDFNLLNPMGRNNTHGSVTLQSANVLVRPTAPGILVTQ